MDSKLQEALAVLKEQHKEVTEAIEVITQYFSKNKEPELKEGQWCFMWDYDTHKRVLQFKNKTPDHYAYNYPYVGIYSGNWKHASIIDEPILTWFPYEGFRPDWVGDNDTIVVEYKDGRVVFYTGKILGDPRTSNFSRFALFQRAKK